jgi:hypothetical protein
MLRCYNILLISCNGPLTIFMRNNNLKFGDLFLKNTYIMLDNLNFHIVHKIKDLIHTNILKQ